VHWTEGPLVHAGACIAGISEQRQAGTRAGKAEGISVLQGLEAKKDTERAAAKTGSHWAKENEADAAERTR
jgi:hypothetical protein